MDFYWITQLGDADFCPPVKDISVAHFLLIHCSCSHASRLVIHIVGLNGWDIRLQFSPEHWTEGEAVITLP